MAAQVELLQILKGLRAPRHEPGGSVYLLLQLLHFRVHNADGRFDDVFLVHREAIAERAHEKSPRELELLDHDFGRSPDLLELREFRAADI